MKEFDIISIRLKTHILKVVRTAWTWKGANKREEIMTLKKKRNEDEKCSGYSLSFNW
jgi:hypothetical protein